MNVEYWVAGARVLEASNCQSIFRTSSVSRLAPFSRALSTAVPQRRDLNNCASSRVRRSVANPKQRIVALPLPDEHVPSAQQRGGAVDVPI